ncbi:siderophore-iron reductase FhuF [Metabacillus malikii]|uniref:Siderophore-iron reductase FhuF n=1 Tax=Metabacillus malikii TaxID=1504265 RepID=A0ABT9ZDL1_9BACI|nr:siderophore-iron reductase FhuF [Metabacillus malikii]MDQ0229668.1 siderophore-iron reductase FhuF [Metabacillus malikii]
MTMLTHTEIEALKKFRLSTEKAAKSRSGVDFLSPEQLQAIFHEDLADKLNTDKQHVIGSMLVKSYAFLAALILHAMSHYDKGINSSLEQVAVQTNDTGPFWLPSFYFHKLDVTLPNGDRDEWRSTIVSQLFRENISKVITAIAQYARLSKRILWENVATYIFWMYESLLEESLSEERREIVRKDFHYVINEASADIFGETSNPLTPFYVKKENNLRMRKTCCLFYLTSTNQDRCQNCPLVCKKHK